MIQNSRKEKLSQSCTKNLNTVRDDRYSFACVIINVWRGGDGLWSGPLFKWDLPTTGGPKQAGNHNSNSSTYTKHNHSSV